MTFDTSCPSSFTSCRRSGALKTFYLLAQLLHLLQEPKVLPSQALEVVHISSGQNQVVVTSLGRATSSRKLPTFGRQKIATPVQWCVS